MGFTIRVPTEVFVDNSAAIHMGKVKTTKRNTHFDTSWFYWQESIAREEARVVKVDTNYNDADFGTKKLAYPKFSYFREANG